MQLEFRFLAGGGELGERIRAYNWRSTPLGPIELWPQSLKTSISLMLNSQHPMWIGWGREITFLYNDAYIQVLSAAKHPEALGKPASLVWEEIWDICGPLADKVFQKGQASFQNDVRLFMNRGDFLEETFYSFSYSPIRDESGNVAGLFCPSAEVTAKNLNTRRLRTLSELAVGSLTQKTTPEACSSAAAILANNSDDIPFALLYLIDAEGKLALLEQAVRLERGIDKISPLRVELDPALNYQEFWPLAEVMRTGQSKTVSLRGIKAFPMGAANQPTTNALIVPLVSRGQERSLGLLIAGINPARRLDDEYRTFYELVASHVAMAIQNARSAEEERKRADTLAALDRAKTTFFSNVSHELRTPLTLILGPLEDELRESSSPNPRLALAHRNSLRLLKLVNTLLDFNRIEAGRVVATYEPVELAAYTTELASVFRSGIEKSALRFIVNCPPLAEPVLIDRDMWEKIVFNLLSNALKYTKSGEIEISLGETQIAGIKSAILSVRDTGIGIPPEELPRVFERFHRIKSTWARSHEGTGIGLALVQELARLHGGCVRVDSKVNYGTIFQVSLPMGSAHLPQECIYIARQPASLSLRAQTFLDESLHWQPDDISIIDIFEFQKNPDETKQNKARILLADDNNDMRRYIYRLLQNHGYEVIAVSDGKAALESAHNHPPSLILSDVMMPQMDAFELLKALRSDSKLAMIPVILLSARAGEEARIEGVEAGADDYLTKPFSARELLARVKTHLELARIRREAQEAVLEREEKLRATLDSITDGFYVIDANANITFFNASARHLLLPYGYDPDALIGQNLFEVFPPLIDTEVGKALKRALKERVPTQAENLYPPWQRWFSTRHYPAIDGGVSTFFQDITERKQNEDEIRKRDNALRTITDNAPAIISRLDRQLRHIFVNSAVTRSTGIPVEKYLGKTNEELGHPPELCQLWSKAFQSVFETGQSKQFEFLYNSINGPVYMATSVVPEKSKNGEVETILVVSTDITERKRAEQALRETETKFRLYFNSSIIGNIIGDLDGKIYEANDEYLRIIGYTREDITNNAVRWDAITPPEHLNRDYQAIELARQNGFSDPYEKQYIRKDGTRIWVLVGFVIYEGTKSIAFILDISERKAAENALYQSEQRLRAIYDGTQVYMGLLTRQGILIETNHASLTFADSRQEGVIGLPFWETIWFKFTPKAPDKIRAGVARAAAGEFVRFDALLNTPDGEAKTYDISLAPIQNDEGEIILIVPELRDITIQKKAEKALLEANVYLEDKATHLEALVNQRTAKLRETYGDLESFSYSIAHDMRAPLRSLQGYSEILLNEYTDKIDADGQRFLQRIALSAGRMDRLIQDVLNYSRVVRGDLTMEPVDVEQLILGILETYPMFGFEKADITLIRPFPKALGNEAMLMQVFSNLMGNAVKFVHPGVKSQIKVRAEEEGKFVRFLVEDNGIGIAPDQHERIFSIFQQLNKDIEGTGIGLAIVKKAAERMGAKIGLKSELNRGSTFWIELQKA